MTLIFPNLDTLRLALTSGAVPPAVSLSPVQATIGSDGRICVAPAKPLSDATAKELKRLGVATQEKEIALELSLSCWPQLVPLHRDARSWGQEDKTPILFELADGRQLPELVSEMLRLGNDCQSFRWLSAEGEGAGASDTGRALLRVIGPPYYSLLRALDVSDNDKTDGLPAPRAYRELNPRLWVQVGYTHPLVEHIQPPAGKLLLMSSPRRWTVIDDGAFHDIYDILDFTLPSAPVGWREIELAQRITVPLRLAPANATDTGELWVLKKDGVAQLDQLVQNADDQLLGRLAFAVSESAGGQTIVLRARPSKQPAPVLVLDGIAFRPFLRLPNLFLPCGQRLHPPLRRDAVLRLLASDPQRVTWLYPTGEGGGEGNFTPESLPDDAFRPLPQWVDYVIDRDHEALTAWVQANRFDFESFVCPDEQPARPPSGPKEPRSKKPPSDRDDKADSRSQPAIDVVNKSRSKKKNAPVAEMIVPAKPSEIERELRGLQQTFVEMKEPLDSPARQAFWPRLAQLHAALDQADDSAICIGNALWEGEGDAGHLLKYFRHGSESMASAALAILGNKYPKPEDARDLAMMLVQAAGVETSLGELNPHLGRIQQFLEKHEGFLGIRLAWLAWEAVHRLAAGDVLTMARARDRLLERLYLLGLSVDLDLPSFLRFNGSKSSDRFRQVREQILRLRPMAHKWLTKGFLVQSGTALYADLIFAFGLARLGESTQCHKVLREANEHLPTRDEVHAWLIQAFEFRILEALEGKVGSNRLPADMLQRLESMDRLARYKVDRMRENSRILEPHEKIDPYRRWHGQFADDLSRELACLFDIHDRNQLADRLGMLLKPKAKATHPEPRILATALELAPRIGETFANNVLFLLGQTLKKLAAPLEEALLLEKGLYLAGHYDKKDDVQDLVARFHTLLEGKGQHLPEQSLESLLGSSFRSLRKLGLRDEVGRLLERMAQGIRPGSAAPHADAPAQGAVGRLMKRVTKAFKKSPSANDPENSPEAASAEQTAKAQRLLLQVASGCFYFGQPDRAWLLLDRARDLLLEGGLIPVEQTALSCAYVAALGQAPIELALPRINELFRRLNGVHDTFTTSTHFSLARLNLVEATVFALVSDDFTAAPEVRRFLDEDEFLVRRRIHRTVKAAIESAGL